MGRFGVKNEEKVPSETNKRGKGFGGKHNVWREALYRTSEALNMIQVKFNYW